MNIRPTITGLNTKLRVSHRGMASVIAVLAACGSDNDSLGPELPGAPHRVFAACRDSTLSVFDVAQGRVIATVSMPGQPVSVTASPDGRRIYAGLATHGGIVEVDASSLNVLRTFPGPRMGLGIEVTPDGRTLVATTDSAGLVMILSLESWELLDSLQTGGYPQYIRVHPTGGTAYAPLFDSGELAVINLTTRSIEARTVLGEFQGGPVGVVISPDGGLVYVGIYGRGIDLRLTDLVIVDVASNAVFRRVHTGYWAIDVDITPDGREVLLAADKIRVFDVVTGAITDSIPVSAFGIAVPDSGDVFYAVWSETNTLEAIRIADHLPVSSFVVGNRPIAVEANFRP